MPSIARTASCITRAACALLLLLPLGGPLAAQDVQGIPLGAKFAGELAAGQADAFVFEGVAGTLVTLRIKGQPGLAPQITLEDAQTGEVLAQASGPKSAAIVKHELPQTGLYRVLVEGTDAGPAGLYVGRGKGKAPKTASKATLSPKDGAANALLTFPAVEGARLKGSIKRLDGVGGVDWLTLVGPAGEIDLADAVTAAANGQVLKLTLDALPALGNYVLLADAPPTLLKAKFVVKPPPPVKGTEAVDPPAVQAALGLDVATGTAPLTVTFADGSTGPVTARSWDFGDGNGSTAAAPVHVFGEAGTYTVRLRVAGDDGVPQTAETEVEVLAGEPPAEPPPVADFDADVTLGEAPFEVAFQDLSTGTIDTWAWDFGDGEVSADASPAHTYVTPGVYSVRLTVSGPGGPHSLTQDALVTVPGPADAVLADMSAAPTTGLQPLVVAFSDQSTGPVLSRTWDFGDGTQSDLAHPVHVYTSPGVYTVTYTVESAAASDVATFVDHVVVEEGGFGELDYTLDIHPIWSAVGASCTGCHGNAGGLTLAGTPEASYPEVLDRVNLAQPANSLILRKPAGLVPHGGGKKWAGGVNDIRYQMVLAWIEQGAQGP